MLFRVHKGVHERKTHYDSVIYHKAYTPTLNKQIQYRVILNTVALNSRKPPQPANCGLFDFHAVAYDCITSWVKGAPKGVPKRIYALQFGYTPYSIYRWHDGKADRYSDKGMD
ncbi:hypothetical protein EHW66_21525 [Erwinia psidii]|nr:hypothetical protein [Erwinia psidii]